MAADERTPWSRRRFLAVGVAGGAAALAVAGGVTARSQGTSPSGFGALFGDRTAAVAELGRSAIDSGAVSADPATLVASLPAGAALVDGRHAPLDVTEPDRFAAGLAAAVAAELAAGELVWVDGFPLTPTEAATCAGCAVGPR
jgi:hypothetical protein